MNCLGFHRNNFLFSASYQGLKGKLTADSKFQDPAFFWSINPQNRALNQKKPWQLVQLSLVQSALTGVGRFGPNLVSMAGIHLEFTPKQKYPPPAPRGGLQGPSNFVVWRNWSGHLSHEWAWIKNLAVWPEGGLKAFQNKPKKFLDPASFRSSRNTLTFFGAIFALKKMGDRT